jgi:hypothetical protein
MMFAGLLVIVDCPVTDSALFAVVSALVVVVASTTDPFGASVGAFSLVAPADALGKAYDKTTKEADDKAPTDATSEKAPTEAPKGSVVDATTTTNAETTANKAESVTGQSTMTSNPANIMMFCGALALSF